MSNIVDVQYLGVAPTIEAWGQFLKETDDATLLGYFMNWHANQPGARPETKAELSGLTEKLQEVSRVSFKLALAPRISLSAAEPHIL